MTTVASGEDALRYPMSLGSYIFRRVLHLANALLVIYYVMPDEFFLLPKKAWLVILFGISPLVIEFIRIRKNVLLLGQREHENRAPGSFFWSLWASTLIILVMPQQIAVPIIMVYAIGDPILGEIRLWKRGLVFPLGGAIIFLLFLPFGYHWWLAVFAAVFMVVGEAVEMVGEVRIRPELLAFYQKYVHFDLSRIVFKTDDDGTTQIVPALALGFLYIYWPGIFPDPIFPVMF